MGIFHCIRRDILPFWESILTVVTPFALLPIPVLIGTQEAKCGYVILIMAIYWVFDLLPLAVTSLIPVFAFPFMGILSSKEVSMVYMVDTNMLFIGGLMVAVAIEYCNLHKRIALFVILRVGQSPRRLIAGFMITTMFLSMWISNTASTAMMVPIVDAIVNELFKRDEDVSLENLKTGGEIAEEEAAKQELSSIENGEAKTEDKDKNEQESTALKAEVLTEDEQTKISMRHMSFLSVCYAANIGGTGTITGSGTNFVFKGVFDGSFPEQRDMTFPSWMVYNVPGMLICGFIGWLWLQFYYMGIGKYSKMPETTPEKESAVKKIIQTKYNELGPMTFHETATLTVFLCLVMLWLFKDPGFITGWNAVFEDLLGDSYKGIDDGAPSIFMATFLFVIPRELKFWPFNPGKDSTKRKAAQPLLTWDVVHKKLPWGLIILIGAGFAMATGSRESGLSYWMGQQLRVLDFMPLPAIVVTLCILIAMATEITSNAATASILMPVLRDLSVSLCVNPLYLMMPAVISCSFAFMLPVATPPNAIVFGASGMKTIEMIKAGFVMNILCVAVCVILINTYGVLIFDLNTIPPWMNTTSTSLLLTC